MKKPQPFENKEHAGRDIERSVRVILENAGWSVQSGHRSGERVADLLARHPGGAYAIELKGLSQGRADRLIPAWAQAWLEVSARAPAGYHPMAVVAAPRIAPKAADRVLDFVARYVPEAAAGVIDLAGLARFHGAGLENLKAEPRRMPGWQAPHSPRNIFSDSNQWMLKVLLAPALAEGYLSAPRVRCQGAAELARAADVSVMSAFRLVDQLRSEGFLDESGGWLNLVRRKALFDRWRAAASRKVNEIPMRFRLKGMGPESIRAMVSGNSACLALFAAADAHGVGLVSGVPPSVYVRKFEGPEEFDKRNLVRVRGDELPDLILRQSGAQRSVFRGAVLRDGQLVSDIIQVWLDVSSHPSRGKEQADLIERGILHSVIHGDGSNG